MEADKSGSSARRDGEQISGGQQQKLSWRTSPSRRRRLNSSASRLLKHWHPLSQHYVMEQMSLSALEVKKKQLPSTTTLCTASQRHRRFRYLGSKRDKVEQVPSTTVGIGELQEHHQRKPCNNRGCSSCHLC